MEEQLAKDAGEITPSVESATTETNASEETQTSEKTEITEQPVEEKEVKTVPLKALQEERRRRKEAEEYVKSLSSREPEYEEEAEQIPLPPEREVNLPPNVMTRDEYEFKEKEKRAWEEVKSEIPEAAENQKILDMAEAYRQASIIQGRGYMTPKEATKEIVSLLKEAQAKGKQSAQETVEYVKRQSLEEGTTSKVVDDSENVNALKSKLSSKNKRESNDALLELLKTNKI